MNVFLKEVLDALFPKDFTCDICGRETFGTNICDDCAKTLIFNDKDKCPVCGRKTVRSEFCIECKAKPPTYKMAASAFVYEGSAAYLIKKFKNGGSYLKDYLADRICKAVKDFPEYDCIVCVPMTRRSKSRRGYNQSELLAKAVAARVGKPYIKGAVEKRKETGEQKELTRKERSKNLAGCFRVVKRDAVKGKRVLVVDDILTTGATADEMAKALLKAGATAVYLATAASVEYKFNGKDKPRAK